VLALLDHHLLGLGGTYGNPNAGDPLQYDELRIEHNEGDVEIVGYNQAIMLFVTDTKSVRRIHQVCCRLEDYAGRRDSGSPTDRRSRAARCRRRAIRRQRENA